MVIKDRDFKAIDKATEEFFKNGKIETRCPRCGGELRCNVYGNSYEIMCLQEDLLLDSVRGV